MAGLFNLFKRKETREKESINKVMFNYLTENKHDYRQHNGFIVLQLVSNNDLVFKMYLRYVEDLSALSILSELPLIMKPELKETTLAFINKMNYGTDVFAIYNQTHTIFCKEMSIIDPVNFSGQILDAMFMIHYKFACAWLTVVQDILHGQTDVDVLQKTFFKVAKS